MRGLQNALDAVLTVAQDENRKVAVLEGLAAHATAIEVARAATDPIRTPRITFDPGDPKVVARMVSIALLAQPLIPLRDIRPAYGSGVYAIYYRGTHPLYRDISGSETPIYIGKADPVLDDANTTREQGTRLTTRLTEHADNIAVVEAYTGRRGYPARPIKVADFLCRRLVCATNAQLASERHLIRMFWPVWNAETKACWGMSKHGDSAKTRANSRSPWDVVHPGRLWALSRRLKDSLTVEEVRERIKTTLRKCPPRRGHSALFSELIDSFRQEEVRRARNRMPPVGTAGGPAEDEAGDGDD